ncbi:unnamed protein product [Boreogadus saida]
MASVLSYFSGPEELEDVNHARGLLKELKSLYDSRLLADIVIGVQGDGSLDHCDEQSVKGDIEKLFQCNRNILAAASPYFKSMFTGGLNENTLDVDCERKVCSAALQWIQANAPVETEDALQVLRCVRWNLFAEGDKAYLESLMASPLIEKYLAYFVNRSSEEDISAKSATPKHRIGASAKEMILFFGLPNDNIMCCDPYSEDLYFMAPPLVDLSSQDYKRSTMESLIACATPENNLYLASHLSKHFWLYNPLLNNWQELAERPLARIHSGMGYLNGHVYILGGRSPVTDVRLKEVECYSVQRNQWTFVAPLPHSLGKMQVVTLHEHLYVVNRRRMLCYDPRRNRWRNCGSLRRDKLHKACVFQDQIVCVCDIPVVKAYSPSRGEWKRLGDIPIDSRALNYQVIQHDGKLLLLTQTLLQHNKNRMLIHEYEPARDTWKNVMAVYVCTLGPVCVATRLYPPCLGSAHSVSMEEEDDSGSSADWDLDGLTDAESDSASSSSFSDENW